MMQSGRAIVLRTMSMSTSKSRPLIATVVVACSIATMMLLRRRKCSKIDTVSNNDNFISIQLLPIEQTLAMGGGGDNAMSTLTWFQGNLEKTILLLQERCRAILEQNPWLGGRVVKQKGTYVLRYSPTNLNLEEYFQVISTTSLSQDTPIHELGSHLKHLLLKNGPTQPLWKVTVIPSKDNQLFIALVFTISHVIADGATFYKIQNMLTFAEPIEPLTVERIATTQQQEQQVERMGGEAEYSLLSSIPFVLNCIGGVLKALTIGPKATTRTFLVDTEGMRIAKQEAATLGSVEFVSTNDVLTSWFLQQSGCTHGCMAVNFRGRLAGPTEHHAGNYENVIFYRSPDSSSPSLIRKSISNSTTLKRTVTNDEPICFLEIVFGSTALATNWSSFSLPPKIPNCTEELHLPLYDMASLLPTTMATMTIFRLSGDRNLAIMVAGTPDKLELLKNVPFLKEWKDGMQ